jgi:putative ABC transport system permease protein|tara:strand:+ start:540 stop:1760 length:1221 start_codon:yes stop_codon:yes gene_type:complete
MKTVIKIAWRNIWRNKLRSLTVIVSMVLGLFSGLFAVSMMLGLNDQRMDSAVDSYLSHIQIHHPSFNENFDIKHTVQNFDSLKISLKNDQSIKAFSSRTIISGMASTAHGSAGIRLIGIDPSSESKVTNVHTSMVKGTYFNSIKSKPALIGKKLAEKLQLDIKKKIYLTFVDENGDQQRIKLKVEGIFKTASTLFDRTNIYMKREDLQKILANSSAIHEIGIICENFNIVDSKVDGLNKSFPNNKVESWGQIAPELGYAQEIMGSVIYIFMGIILIALSFGIINTMLMAVLERKKELGMLMSVGLNKRKVFFMVVFETLFISLVAAPIGIFLSYSFISYFGIHGIDLSSVGEGLEELGIGTRVFTKLSFDNYINITILTLIVTFFSSLIPARRALKLNPAEAVRAL